MAKAKQIEWRKISPHPVVLSFGPEDYLISRTIRAVREQLRAADPNLEVHEIEASDYYAGQLADLTSPSLFAEPKLLIIRATERCTDELIADGIAYLEAPTPDATVIFVHSGATVRGKKLLDAIRASAKAAEVLCPKIKKDAERAAFVNAEFAAEGRQITASAVRALLDAFGEGLSELAAACGQLLQDSAATISEEIVDAYYGGRVETTSWKISDAAMAARPAEALSQLRHALATGIDPVPIVSTLASTVRQSAKIFGNRSVTAVSLGVEPWKFEKMRNSLGGWTEEGLAKVINACVEADAAAKGAERDPSYSLEKLVLLIAAKGVK